MNPLLVVDDLRVSYPNRDGAYVEVVRGVSFTLGRERLGIVGESGSGKSQTGRAILGLTPPQGHVTAKRLTFDGIDLLTCPPRQRRNLRGDRIAMVLQDPKFSLNPVIRVGQQIAESLRDHQGLRGRAARARVHELLSAVRIRDPRRVAAAWPHELSGGMGQRAMIAMMLAGDPDLLIADEPTSALDVTVQLQVLAILDDLVSERGMGLIFIPLNTMAFATIAPQHRTDGSSLLNLLRSLGASVGISVVTTLLGSNTQTSHEDLAAHVTNSSVGLLDPSTSDRFGAMGDTAMAMINAEINRQAAMVAYIDDFWLMMWVTALSVPLVLLLRPPRADAPKASAADMGH